MKRIWLPALSAVAIGCGAGDSPKVEPAMQAMGSPVEVPSLDAPPELLAYSEPGFADMTFFVSKVESRDGALRIGARALYAGKPVGLVIEIPLKWQTTMPFPEMEGKILHSGSVTLKPLDGLSDEFLAAATKAYELPETSSKFVDKVWAEAVCLVGDPNGLDLEPCRIKAFFIGGEKDTDPYAEVFFAIDLEKRSVRIEEKDVSYRADLVKMWSGAKKGA